MIPEAVFSELTVDERFQLEANQIRQKKYITVIPITNLNAVNLSKRATGLDLGEILTDEYNADLLLIDEAKGRTVSTKMGLKIMGTIGILMAAYEERQLTANEVRECISGLQRAGRHISNKHYQLLLDKLKNL